MSYFVICVCLVRLYLQLFVGGRMSYLCYLCLFGSSLPPVVCRGSHILFMLFVFVWFVFTSSCLKGVLYLIYVICVCLVHLYLQLFVGGLISYLCYFCLFGSSLPPVVCRRSCVLFMLFVFVLVRLYLQLFVGGLISYLCYLCLFGSSLPPIVCRRSCVLFMLFVFVWFVFTTSCL
jgi:hypothetical protein